MYASRFYAFLRMVTSVTHFLKYFSLHSCKLVLQSQPPVFRFLITDEVTSVFSKFFTSSFVLPRHLMLFFEQFKYSYFTPLFKLVVTFHIL